MSHLEKLYGVSEAMVITGLEKGGYSSLAHRAHKATEDAHSASHVANRKGFDAQMHGHEEGTYQPAGYGAVGKHPSAGSAHRNAFYAQRRARTEHGLALAVAPTPHHKAYHQKMLDLHSEQLKHHDIMAAHHEAGNPKSK